MNGTFNTLKVSNGDLEIRFSCAYYGRRIRETINNLGVKCDDESKEQIKSRFTGKDKDVTFVFGEKPMEDGSLFIRPTSLKTQTMRLLFLARMESRWIAAV